MTDFSLSIDATRLQRHIEALGEIGALPGGGICRLALTDEDRGARDFIVAEMRRLGLRVHVDQIGNIFGIRSGSGGPAVMTGSHIDTVGTGGLYDGNLGVLAGLEVLETLDDARISTTCPIIVAVFTNEEGVRFAPDMMGSLVFTGGLSLDAALAVADSDGITVETALQRIGYAGEPFTVPELRAFLELHVEQGPVLERIDTTIGVVEGVQGISWSEFTLLGVSNHAGTTPMQLRHDAGLVAAKLMVFARDLAKAMGPPQVATVGSLTLSPNLINVVPNRATVCLDLRNLHEAQLKDAEARAFAFVAEEALKEGVSIDRRSLVRLEPVTFDASIKARITEAAVGLGFRHCVLPSGAGHDAQMLARRCPAGMIFVPSVGGISHNVREFTSAADIEAGANVLLHVLLELAA